MFAEATLFLSQKACANDLSSSDLNRKATADSFVWILVWYRCVWTDMDSILGCRWLGLTPSCCRLSQTPGCCRLGQIPGCQKILDVLVYSGVGATGCAFFWGAPKDTDESRSNFLFVRCFILVTGKHILGVIKPLNFLLKTCILLKPFLLCLSEYWGRIIWLLPFSMFISHMT